MASRERVRGFRRCGNPLKSLRAKNLQDSSVRKDVGAALSRLRTPCDFGRSGPPEHLAKLRADSVRKPTPNRYYRTSSQTNSLPGYDFVFPASRLVSVAAIASSNYSTSAPDPLRSHPPSAGAQFSTLEIHLVITLITYAKIFTS